MSEKKKKGGVNKFKVGVILLVLLTVATFIWHDVRVSKRDKAQEAQMIQEW